MKVNGLSSLPPNCVALARDLGGSWVGVGIQVGVTMGEAGVVSESKEWGIVMSSPTVTNDRTEFANCDGTQFRCLKTALHETPSGGHSSDYSPPSDRF